eukprot:g16541.t1
MKPSPATKESLALLKNVANSQQAQLEEFGALAEDLKAGTRLSVQNVPTLIEKAKELEQLFRKIDALGAYVGKVEKAIERLEGCLEVIEREYTPDVVDKEYTPDVVDKEYTPDVVDKVDSFVEYLFSSRTTRKPLHEVWRPIRFIPQTDVVFKRPEEGKTEKETKNSSKEGKAAGPSTTPEAPEGTQQPPAAAAPSTTPEAPEGTQQVDT